MDVFLHLTDFVWMFFLQRINLRAIFANELNIFQYMKLKKINTVKDSKNSHINKELNELNILIKKTKLQDKVLKKMIEEIKKSTTEE